MKGIKLLFVLFLAISGWNASSQNVLPPLTDNLSAQNMIKREIKNLELLNQANPKVEHERKLYLYQTTLEFLAAPTTVTPQTESAVTSAFVLHEMKWSGIEEADAIKKFNNKQWSNEFHDLINLIKYF